MPKLMFIANYRYIITIVIFILTIIFLRNGRIRPHDVYYHDLPLPDITFLYINILFVSRYR